MKRWLDQALFIAISWHISSFQLSPDCLTRLTRDGRREQGATVETRNNNHSRLQQQSLHCSLRLSCCCHSSYVKLIHRLHTVSILLTFPKALVHGTGLSVMLFLTPAGCCCVVCLKASSQLWLPPARPHATDWVQSIAAGSQQLFRLHSCHNIVCQHYPE